MSDLCVAVKAGRARVLLALPIALEATTAPKLGTYTSQLGWKPERPYLELGLEVCETPNCCVSACI